MAPQGVLRIYFLEAQDLEGKDTFLGGLIKGKSDPYGILQIGNQLFQSKTIKETLHPKWNEVYEVRVWDACWSRRGAFPPKLLQLFVAIEKADVSYSYEPLLSTFLI